MDKRISYRGGRSRKGGFGLRYRRDINFFGSAVNDGLDSVIFGKKWTGDFVKGIEFDTEFPVYGSGFDKRIDRKVDGFYSVDMSPEAGYSPTDIYPPYTLPITSQSIYGARIRPETNKIIGYEDRSPKFISGPQNPRMEERRVGSGALYDISAYQYGTRPLIGDGTGLIGPFTFEEATFISCNARQISLREDSILKIISTTNSGPASSSLQTDIFTAENLDTKSLIYEPYNDFPNFRQPLSINPTFNYEFKYVSNDQYPYYTDNTQYLRFSASLGSSIIVDVDNQKDCYLRLTVMAVLENSAQSSFILNSSNYPYTTYYSTRHFKKSMICNIYGAVKYLTGDNLQKFGKVPFSHDFNYTSSGSTYDGNTTATEIIGTFHYKNKSKQFKMVRRDYEQTRTFSSGGAGSNSTSLDVDIHIEVSEWEPFATTTGSPVWDSETGEAINDPFS